MTKLSILLSSLAICSFAFSDSAEAKVRKGEKAKEFVSIKNVDGKTMNLSQYKGKVVVMTFGASWCKPCSKELPVLEKLANKYDKKKVVFLAINIDSNVSKGKAFLEKAGLKVVQRLFDSTLSTTEIYEPPTMPSTYLIKNGIVTHLHQGFREGYLASLKKVIDQSVTK